MLALVHRFLLDPLALFPMPPYLGYGSPSRRMPMARFEMTEPAVDEVAENLGAAQDSIYRWSEPRGMPVRKIARLWKFKLSEVVE